MGDIRRTCDSAPALQSVSKDFAFVKTKKVIKKNKYLKIHNINLTLFFYLIW